MVTLVAGAYIWRGACTVDAVEIANRLADTLFLLFFKGQMRFFKKISCD